MSTSISPPPERDFPAGHQARRRQQLVSIIRADGRPSKLRLWVPMAAAASVFALIAGGVVAMQALRPDGTPQVAASNTTPVTLPADQKPKPVSTQRAKPSVAEPVTHEITGGELRDLFDDCVQTDRDSIGDSDNPISFQTFERPLFAFTGEWQGSHTRTWLVAVRGDGKKVDDRAICTQDEDGLTAYGQMLGHGPKGDGYLYQIVSGGDAGAGFVMPQVASVTFQPKGEDGVETRAVVRDGMFFYPENDQGGGPPEIDQGGGPTSTKPDDNLIRLPGWAYLYRAYDSAGRQIYDSKVDGPFAKDCYTNPAGNQVIVVNSVKNPTPESCERTYEWTAP
jgi:hypothetical protein